MGTHYLMTPLDEEDLGKWSISAELFLEEAARKWPEIIVRTSEKSELCSATVEIPVVGNRSISLRLLSVKRTKTNAHSSVKCNTQSPSQKRLIGIV